MADNDPSKKILLIEDDVGLAEFIQWQLQRDGYEVLIAYRGEEGLRQAQAWQPDLLILDIMLPEMDGFEVCRCIKENPETRHIPVVILTARKSTHDYARGVEVGADAYITKPFKSAHVVETLEGLLGRRS
jgi:twitching motility two-component system response regulator PilG